MPVLKMSEVLTPAGPVRFSHTKGLTKTASVILLEENEKARRSPVKKDVFLSHRYSDGRLVLRLKRIIERCGYSVFVDWIDAPELGRTKVTVANARKLRDRMRNCHCLLYAHTVNSATSVWMPWELGYFDGKNGRAAILPIEPTDRETDRFVGTEYLALYPYVTKEINTEKQEQLWIQETPTKYVSLRGWINGKKPFERS